jgi:hypothetical protein
MEPATGGRPKIGQRCCPFGLVQRLGMNYLLQCSTTIGVVVLLPFLGVSSLNFGPLATAAFFLALSITITRYGALQPCNFGLFVSYFIPLDPDASLKGCRLDSGAIRGIGNRSEHGGHSGCAI